jgi:hypothetical protein
MLRYRFTIRLVAWLDSSESGNEAVCLKRPEMRPYECGCCLESRILGPVLALPEEIDMLA